MQRGTCAIVMRVIPSNVPDFAALSLPAELEKIVGLKNGVVLVTVNYGISRRHRRCR